MPPRCWRRESRHGLVASPPCSSTSRPVGRSVGRKRLGKAAVPTTELHGYAGDGRNIEVGVLGGKHLDTLLCEGANQSVFLPLLERTKRRRGGHLLGADVVAKRLVNGFVHEVEELVVGRNDFAPARCASARSARRLGTWHRRQT